MSMGVVAGVAVAMLLFGFLLGTRARQLVASAKMMGSALRKLTGIKIPTPTDEEAAAAAAAASSSADDMEGEEDEGNADVLGSFLNLTYSGLDDHPNLEVNPVLMYQIRQEKDRQRAMKRYEEMRRMLGDTEGMSEEEIAERLAAQELAGGGAQGFDARQNALALLIANGARVTSINSASSESAALAERRRLFRNVDVYLQKTREIETAKEKPGTTSAYNKDGSRRKTAYEVARETEYAAHKVHAGSTREGRNVGVAKSGRDILRQWEIRRRQQPGYNPDEDNDSEDEERERVREELRNQKKKRGGGSAVINASDLAGLAALLEQDDSDDEQHAGDENDDLAA